MDELVRRATKGERDALQALFQAGEEAFAAGRLREASELLKESAVCCRIDAHRQHAHRSSSDADRAHLESEIKALESLLGDYVPPLPEGGDPAIGTVQPDDIPATIRSAAQRLQIHSRPRHPCRSPTHREQGSQAVAAG